MQFPLITEYVRAIEEASENLDKLAHLTPVLDNHGEPFRSSGAFAVVFKMKDEQTGKCYALKCFTEDQTGRAEAYQKIAEELDMVDSTYVTSVKYLENEIFVDSTCENEEFPVLLMDWVEGETMETYIANNYQNEHAMSMLCYRFCKLAAWLRSQPFAHGDIKPDNIMVRPDGSLTLVDYDGMFVPAMKGGISPTLGTKDFCHPLRTVNDFDETIDDFSLASIALSLKALSLNPTLLKDFGASDRLIFSADDYRDLGNSKVIASLQTLFNDSDFLKLYALFLLAHSQRSLSMCSFRLFGVEKPKEEEVLSTEVTKEDLENAVEDEFGVKYSKDGKRLLRAPGFLDQGTIRREYTIRNGTKMICDKAFYFCKFTAIHIPDSVTSIGDYAFYCCKKLTSITLPLNINTINGNPFRGWNGELIVKSDNFIYEDDVLFDKHKRRLIAYRSKNKDYEIPNSVTSIGDSAFHDCYNLSSIHIPDGVTSIGRSAFSNCNNLTAIHIPDSVTSIGDSAFYCCRSLTSIHIPDSVTSIGDRAFSGCESLTFITLPLNINTINGNSFAYWNGELIVKSDNFIYEDGVLFDKYKRRLIAYRSKKKDYEIPNSVTSIGDNAFSDCKNITSIHIPDSITSIGDRAFCGCKSLTSIHIPDSVTSIGDSAFYCCRSLTSIHIPDSVTSIGDSAFGVCESLTSIHIPDSVTSIGDRAFHSCNNLTAIHIPDSVTSIGDSAFYCCRSLTSIHISDSVTSIGDSAFWDCVNLTFIHIPDSVTSIGDRAFVGCEKLTSITLPLGMKTININPFRGWSGELIIKSDNFISEDGVLFDKYKRRLIVYCSKNKDYEIPNSITSIGDYAFKDCKDLISIHIPDSVTSIGYSAFSDCKNLTSIHIPDSVTSIGDSAFYGCENLTSIHISDSVTSIGQRAFCRCKSLTSIHIPDSVTSIGYQAFGGCVNLSSIHIPNSVTSIGDGAFLRCERLTFITLPLNINTINGNPFRRWNGELIVKSDNFIYEDGALFDKYKRRLIAYCSKNKDYEIPNSVTSIGESAFGGCNNLTSIHIPDSVTSIGDSAFMGCPLKDSIIQKLISRFGKQIFYL